LFADRTNGKVTTGGTISNLKNIYELGVNEEDLFPLKYLPMNLLKKLSNQQ
jgi:hypothetical protein